MRKLKLFFACLLMVVLSIGQMWADPAPAGTTLFSENFGSYSANNVPSGSVTTATGRVVYGGGSVTYTSADNGKNKTMIYADALASGTSPELLIGKTAGVFTIAGIPSGAAQEITVSFKQNAQKLTVSLSGTGYSTTYTSPKPTAAGTVSFDITVADGADATFTLIMSAGSSNVRVDDILVTVKTAGEGGGDTPPTPAKTLESVAVSGNPTKTSYTAGQDFDPAGLTVTGTYSDESTAPITSGITWAYNPSQTLTENQTSIGVTATVGEVSSAEYNVTGLTVSEGPDVILDLLDAGWGFPKNKVVDETAYTNGGYTIKVAGSTGNGFRVYTGQNILLGKQNAYIELPIFSSPIAKIVVAGNSGGSANVTWNIFKGDVAVSTAVTGCKNEAYTFNIDPLEANVVYRLKVTNDNNLQIKNIKIYFGEVPVVAKPSISGETPFLNSTNVSISIPEGTTVYYTTDGSDPQTAGTLYSASFALNSSATVKAIATDGANWSEMVEKAFVKGTVLSVTEARAAIDAAPAGTENQFVKGIINQIDSYNSNYSSITYWISEDGTATNKLQVYSGLAGVVKEAFESTADLNVGDSVVVKGTIKKYNSTYEFDKNNTVAYRLPIARLAWSAESYAADIDNQQSNVYPTLMNTDNVAISYSSTDGSVATINGQGEISLVAVGTTTIKATFVGSDSYRWNYASYTLNVASSLVHATISFDVDGGDAIEPLTDKQAVVLSELPAATKAGKNFGGWFKDENKTNPAVAEALEGDITLYAKWLEPYTVTEAKAVIDAAPAGTANQYVAGIISKIDSYNSTYNSITYWISADGTTTNQLKVYGGLIGNAATALDKDAFSSKEDLQLGDEVVIVGTLKDYNSTYEFDKDNMIYSFSRKASAGLEYAETAVEKTVGDDAFINPLTNPNSVAVSYGTSNDQVAEVANDGTVTINGEGSAIITATFAGNDQYKAASVSYAITVSAAVVHGSITYVENGAKEDIANVDDATALPDPLPTVTKDNFIFDGWWTTSTFEAGSKAVAGAALTGDVILYAKWNAIPYYATVYTSNVEFTGKNSYESGGSKVIIAGEQYDAQKVGASSNQGQVVVTVPAKTHTLHFHAFTWKNKSNVISISGVTNPSVTTFDVIGDNGGGASSPYTIEGNPINHYYSVTFDDVIEETEITFDYSEGGDKRFIMYGINQEGGVLPVLDHIVITGTATALEYEVGDVFNPAGLGVNAIYTLDNVEQAPVAVDAADIVWSFNPAILTGETSSVTVTATYDGKSANKEVTGLTVTVPATPEILATPAAIDFGTVYQNAIVDAQGISVTLKAVDAATVTLDGEGFSIDKAALSELNSTITVTPATTVAGTFAATVTISDDAGVAADVVINLSMKVEAVEDLSGTWVKATSVAAGDRIIIGATVSGVTKTMGAKNTNNRAAVESTYEDLVLTPAEGTKTFLVVDAGEGKFALQALNGNYLTSATSGTGNNLWEAENYDLNNAKWTITIDGEGVASVVAAAGSKTDLRYNSSNDIFSCYSVGSQKPINIYKKGTPDYGSYQRTVTAGNYGTICLPKAGVISGATLFEIADYDGSMIYVDEILSGEMEAGKPYIFQASSEQLNVVYTSSVAEETAGHANGLYGFYNLENEDAQYDIAQDAGNYILYQNAYWLVSGRAAYIANYRAYIKLSQINNTGNQAPGRRRVAMAVNGEQVATGFENIDATEKPVKLMLNGQIYILRGEKLYDATGRLVK